MEPIVGAIVDVLVVVRVEMFVKELVVVGVATVVVVVAVAFVEVTWEEARLA